MPDKRLIDANALLETHRRRLVQNTIKVENGAMTKPYSNFEAAIMACLAEYLSSAPTIDAVEVVRCRECVHAIVFRTGSVSCRYHDWYRINVDPDGYCNHGEKDIDVPTKNGGAEC